MPPPAGRSSGNRNLPARVGRPTRNAINVARADAIVSTVRIQSTEYVAHSALRAIESLSDMEGFALRRNPHGAARYQVIVDVATARLAQIIAETE